MRETRRASTPRPRMSASRNGASTIWPRSTGSPQQSLREMQTKAGAGAGSEIARRPHRKTPHPTTERPNNKEYQTFLDRDQHRQGRPQQGRRRDDEADRAGRARQQRDRAEIATQLEAERSKLATMKEAVHSSSPRSKRRSTRSSRRSKRPAAVPPKAARCSIACPIASTAKR